MLSPWLPALLSSAAALLQVCFSNTLQEVELYRHVGIGTATHGETGLTQAPRLVNQWHRWGMLAGSTQHLQRLPPSRSAGWLPMLVPLARAGACACLHAAATMEILSVTACKRYAADHHNLTSRCAAASLGSELS